ncbi:hypothetical protein H6F97_29100 [Microcoleus sp. FACHB-1]|nr:hypothetical protein [Microcoleus sp. FACHB-1]
MLLLLVRFPGQRRPERDSNKRPNQPPFQKPERVREQRSSEHINQVKTTEAIRNIQKRYHQERRLFL